jgi:outer membrane lipopolysaccharide assembly protein LptE/RlpB
MRVWLLIVVALANNGCGYALAGRGSFLPSYIRVVGIPPIENRTPVQQIELVLTEKVRTEFIGRGKYRVESDATGADAVLAAEVMSISVQPVAFNQQQIASRYQFIMTMRATFTDSRTNMVLWSNDALTFREEYDLQNVLSGSTIDAGAFFDQERGSIDRIATDVARSVVTAILEAF